MFTKIWVCVDGSPCGDAALEETLQLIESLQQAGSSGKEVDLVLVHAVQINTPIYLPVVSAPLLAFKVELIQFLMSCNVYAPCL